MTLLTTSMPPYFLAFILVYYLQLALTDVQIGEKGSFQSITLEINRRDIKDHALYTNPLEPPGEKMLNPFGTPMIIQQQIHQIWFNFKKGHGYQIPASFQKNTQRIIDFHPGWEYTLWNESMVEELIETNFPWFMNTYWSYENPVQRHDAARIIILFVKGGIYFDHDVLLLKNIEQLFSKYGFVGGFTPFIDGKFHFYNGVLGSVASHPFLIHILKCMISRASIIDPTKSTGPGLLEYAYRTYDRKDESMIFYHHKFLVPLFMHKEAEYLDLDELARRYPDSFALVYFANTWC